MNGNVLTRSKYVCVMEPLNTKKAEIGMMKNKYLTIGNNNDNLTETLPKGLRVN